MRCCKHLVCVCACVFCTVYTVHFCEPFPPFRMWYPAPIPPIPSHLCTYVIQLLLLQFLLISELYPAPTPPVPSHQCALSSSYSSSSFSSVYYIQLLLPQFLLISVLYPAPTPPVPYYLCVIKLPLLHFLLPSPGRLLSLSTPLSLWQGK